MKKIFTVSLVAMMAVTAANADIASTGYVNERTGEQLTGFAAEAGNLNAAVNALKTDLGTVSTTAGNAATKSELTAAQEDLQTAIDTEKGRIDAINSDMSGIQTSISGLESDVGNLADDLEAEVTARTNADTAINNKIGTVAEGKTVVGLIDEAKQAASGANTELAGRVTANENSIKAINDSAVMKSGVTADTVTQVDTNKTDIANIKTEQTAQNEDIAALEASLGAEGATGKAIAEAKKAGTDATAALNAYKETNDAAVNANTTAISNLNSTYATDAELNTAKSEITTAYGAADAETLAGAKQYADGLAGNYATAAQGAKADTAVQREQVGMAESFAVSDACKVNGVICSLTIKGTGTGAVAQWEVVR